MDQAALVANYADAGARLAEAYSKTPYGPVEAAYWKRRHDAGDGRWELHLVVDGLTEENVIDAFEELGRLEAAMAPPKVPPFSATLDLPGEAPPRTMTERASGPGATWAGPSGLEPLDGGPILVYPRPRTGATIAA